MRLFKKNDTQKNNKKLPMTGRVKKGFRFYCMVVMAMTVVLPYWRQIWACDFSS